MSQATAAVQPLLGVRADGRWGKFTQGAYERAKPDVRSRVDEILARNGTSAQSEYRARSVAKSNARQAFNTDTPTGVNLISVSQAEAIVASAAVDLNVERHAAALKAFLRREARRVDLGGVPHYDSLSKNGSSRGLMQMQPAAWADARKKFPGIGDYSNVFDPWRNIYAGVAYSVMNIALLEKARVPVSSDTLYLAHNQGAGFFTKGIVTNYAGQSKEVRDLIDRYRAR